MARRRLARFSADSRGVAALEFALVMPLLVLFLVGVIQFGAIFFLESNMLNSARAAARGLAVGELADASAAQTFVQNDLVTWPATFTVTVTDSGTEFTVQVSVPIADAAIVDPLGLMSTGTIGASATMRKET